MIYLVVSDRNVAMGIHSLCEYCRQYGGTLSTRLVSEEDIEMIWECPVVVETELTRIGHTGMRHTTILYPRDTLRCTWSLAATVTQPLSPARRRRFGI